MPLVIATPTSLEDNVANFVWPDRVVNILTSKCGLYAVQKVIDLVHLISTTQRTPLESLAPFHA